MSKPAMRLVDATSPPRSPERVELASAIERRDAALAVRDRVRAAQERAPDQLYREGGAIDAARKAKAVLEEATADESHHLAAAFINGATAAPSPVEAATAAAEAADAELARVRRVIVVLEEEAADAERGLSFVAMAVDDAVSAAVRADPAVRQLVADFEVASKTYASLRQAMAVVGMSRLPPGTRSYEVIRDLPELPGAAQWQAAIEALRTDADAPMPTS